MKILILMFFIWGCEYQQTKIENTSIKPKVLVDKNRVEYMHEFFSLHKKQVAKFQYYTIHELAETITESQLSVLFNAQRGFSVNFKDKLTNEYMRDSLKVTHSIALIILKIYYITPFRRATDDIGISIANEYRPHIQQIAEKIDIDSAAINTYPLSYFFLRYMKIYLSTYKMSKADAFLFSDAYAYIKKHPKLKKHPPIKKMLQKLAKKKWDGEN